MRWQPVIYRDGKKGEEYDKTCKHSIVSECGNYRISRDISKKDEHKYGKPHYSAWVKSKTAPACALFAGSGSLHCIAAKLPSADDAKRVIDDYARSGTTDTPGVNPTQQHSLPGRAAPAGAHRSAQRPENTG